MSGFSLRIHHIERPQIVIIPYVEAQSYERGSLMEDHGVLYVLTVP